MKINTNDILKTEDGKYICVAKTKDLAILAPFVQHRDGGGKTSYKNMIAVNVDGTDFEFEKIGKLN